MAAMKLLIAIACCLSLLDSSLAIRASRGLRQLITTDPAPTDMLTCDYAIVGGGPGGVYSGYRLLEEGLSDNVCLFEATHRVGGRVYSVRGLGPNKDLVVDMGAYRYMPIEQPIITSLIQNLMKLPNRLYQPGVDDYKIVLDSEGQNAGFATYVETLFSMAQNMGLKATFDARVVQIMETDNGFMLMTEEGTHIMANKVILNLPSRPLHRLMQNSVMPSAVYSPALDKSWVQRATKLYLFYPQAWWTSQGLNNGSLQDNEPWEDVGVQIPVVARYHDGQVKCASASGNGHTDFVYTQQDEIDLSDCYGYFQMVYTSDSGTNNTGEAVDYLADFMGSLTTMADGATTDVPYAVLNASTYGGAHLLQTAHAKLMEYHANSNVTIAANALPTQAIISMWDPSVTWVGGAWHSMKLEEDENNATTTAAALKPFPDLELYVADEAYSTVLGWSEGSLAMAENIIRDYLGGGLPSWLEEDQYQRANYTSSSFNDYEGAPQGGGGTSGQGIIPLAPAPAPGALAAAG